MMLRLNSIKIALLISMIHARLSLEQMKTAFDEIFEDRKGDGLEYTIINPLFGYMFRTNGCLESMRFYSPELETGYAKDARDYKSDDSKDSLIRLLIHLFPSHGGSLNSLVRKKENFRNRYFIDNKPYWSKSGDGSEGSQDNRIETIKMLGETCVKLLKIGTGREMQEITKNNPEPYTLFNWLVFSPSKAFEKEEVYLKILLIQAFLIETLDKKEELKVFLRATLTGLDSDPSIKYPALLPNGKQMQLFKSLYDNPFKFPYSKINQPVSNSSIPVYDRKEDKPIQSKTFSDCADIAILHLCNCLFYDELTEKCSLDHLNNLKDSFTEPNRLKQFYKKYHHKPFQVTEGMRNDWSRVVQGLEDNRAFECQSDYKPYMIYYLKEDYRNELRSGILNIMSVLSQICGLYDAYEEIMTKDTISKDSIAKKLAELFNKISNGNTRVTITGDGIREVAHDNVNDFIGSFDITLVLDSETSVKMKLHISGGHTSFFFEGMKSEVEEVDFSELINLKSDDDSLLLSLLVDRYIKLLNNNDDKTDNFDYFFEVLYNQGLLHTNEQKRNQCIHLCRYMDKIEKEECTSVKKMIENIVKSANLSDPETRIIFRPFFVYIDDIFKKMSNFEVVEVWLSFFGKNLTIQSQPLKNAWNEAYKNNSMKITKLVFSRLWNNTFGVTKTILPALKDTLEDLRFENGIKDSEELTKLVQGFLMNNNVLKSLSITQSKLSATDILNIFKTLEHNTTLKTLRISHDEFGPEDVQRIAEVLKSNSTLTELKFSGDFVTDKEMKCILDAVAQNKFLTTLDISGTKFRGRGAVEYIADALNRNTTLTSLGISTNEILDKEMRYITDALKSNATTLTVLNISNNEIQRNGIKCIAEALKSNTTLTTLNMAGNNLCDSGARLIADALKINKYLISLDISNSKIQNKDMKYIAGALKINTTLTRLNISGNRLGQEGYKHIMSIFARKKIFNLFYIPYFSNPANSTLTSLNISNNLYIIAEHIVDVIKRSESLVSLDIQNCMINDKDLAIIANALAKSKFLKVLNIQSLCKNFGNSKIIFDALKQNRSLEELSINYFDSLAEMVDILKENECLKTLDIQFLDNSFYSQSISLFKAVEKNTTLDRLILRESLQFAYFVISGRMPIDGSENAEKDKFFKPSEFRRVEVCLGSNTTLN